MDTVIEEVEGIKLEDAEVVVAGGRGIGSAEGFKQLEDLAKLLKEIGPGERLSLKPIFDMLKGQVTYDQIKMALVFI